jgi:hypothetical protein
MADLLVAAAAIVPKLLEPESRGAQLMVKPNPPSGDDHDCISPPRRSRLRDPFPVALEEGRGLSFPCDQEGRFDLDNAHPRLRDSYLFARAMMGREYAYPVILARHLH